ncbi:hypothetical protein BDFB_000646, partial [Asbolus verrucosus]
MQQYTLVAVVLGAIAVILTSSSTSASVISCPPNNPQEASPYLRQLCYTIEQVISENVIPEEQYRRLDERNVNANAKRQDVDHVFLRFGRRFGL